jgi:hypothetical protein
MHRILSIYHIGMLVCFAMTLGKRLMNPFSSKNKRDTLFQIFVFIGYYA